MDSSNYHCPRCNSDNISSLPLVYKRGHVINGAYDHSTDLAREVAPPEKPQEPGAGCIAWFVYIAVFICALPIVGWIIGFLFFDKPLRDVVSAVLNFGQALIGPLFLLLLVRLGHHREVRKYHEKMQVWQEKYDAWTKQYICMRCGNIFIRE